MTNFMHYILPKSDLTRFDQALFAYLIDRINTPGTNLIFENQGDCFAIDYQGNTSHYITDTTKLNCLIKLFMLLYPNEKVPTYD